MFAGMTVPDPENMFTPAESAILRKSQQTSVENLEKLMLNMVLTALLTTI
jgi:hypothetical protein